MTRGTTDTRLLSHFSGKKTNITFHIPRPFLPKKFHFTIMFWSMLKEVECEKPAFPLGGNFMFAVRYCKLMI